MKKSLLPYVIAALLLTLSCPSLSLAVEASSEPQIYPSGDVAVAMAECAPLCAEIRLANGDHLKVLAGRASECAPYAVTFIRYHRGQLDQMWNTMIGRTIDVADGSGGCSRVLRSYRYTIIDDVGMAIYNNSSGALFVEFYGGKRRG